MPPPVSSLGQGSLMPGQDVGKCAFLSTQFRVGLSSGPTLPGILVMGVCHARISRGSLHGMTLAYRIWSMKPSFFGGPIWSMFPELLVPQHFVSLLLGDKLQPKPFLFSAAHLPSPLDQNGKFLVPSD